MSPSSTGLEQSRTNVCGCTFAFALAGIFLCALRERRVSGKRESAPAVGVRVGAGFAGRPGVGGAQVSVVWVREVGGE